MSAQLRVVFGKERGKCLTFPRGEYVFGRGPECHVRANSEIVSRQHCLMAVADGVVSIRDLGSANGTLVNGVRVRGERVLCDGDLIQLGPFGLQFQLPHPPSTRETMADSVLSQNGTTVTDASIVKQPELEPVAQASG